MPKGAYRDDFFVHHSQKFMFYIWFAISNRHMLVSFVRFYSALYADNFVFEKEFHTEQILHIDLGLFYLNLLPWRSFDLFFLSVCL
jgi:hypothetical protein